MPEVERRPAAVKRPVACAFETISAQHVGSPAVITTPIAIAVAVASVPLSIGAPPHSSHAPTAEKTGAPRTRLW